MNVTRILDELARLRVTVSADGDDLTIQAPNGALTEELRKRITANKEELLTLLRRDSGGSPPHEVPRMSLAPADRYDPFPLTDIQEAYSVGKSSEFRQGDVSIHFYVEVDGDFDVAGLESAWNRMVERHDMLRCVHLPDGRQRFLDDVPKYSFPVVDLRDHGTPEAELSRIRDELSHQVLPNDRWPAFDIRVSRYSDQRARLHISIDLVNIDGGSLMLLLEEWVRLYHDPATVLEPISFSYRDYVLGERALRLSPDYQKGLDYWKERVAVLPPTPALPLGPGAQNERTTRFVHKAASIERAVWERLENRARDSGVTIAAVLATAYADTLATWSSEPDFTLNVTLFNRLPLHPEVGRVLGDFTSMVLLAAPRAATDTFATRVRAVQDQMWRDLDHHHVSGVRVLRELARTTGNYNGALMPIVFTNMLNLSAHGYQPFHVSLDRLGETVYTITQTPQVWLDYQIHQDARGVHLSWDAVEDMFPPGLVDDMLDSHCRLLRALADEEDAWNAPWARLVPPSQLEQRTAVNETAREIPEVLLHTLFERQAVAHPDRPAVITPARTLDYGELLGRAARLGNRLRALGATPDSLVAVVLEKGWEQVVAVLGVHMAGAAYLPIAPEWPTERVSHLIEHGQGRLVVTVSELDERFTWPAGVASVLVDDVDHGDDPVPPAPVQRQSDLAYVIYTSGSTGAPKGVMIEHRSLVNRLLDVNERAGVGPDDRCLALTPLHHDLSVYDILGTLSAGAAIVMPTAASLRDPTHWLQLLQRERVTVWNSVPAFLDMLVAHLEQTPGASPPSSLRFVILAGDWIPVDLPDRLRRFVDVPQVIASGGPTETTIWDVWYPVSATDPNWTSIPYGRPMANTRYFVLDAALQPCPVWVPGELYIGGAGLARGYWRDEETTKDKFLTHPQTGERLYRSGDLGRYLPDGNIEFLGRDDLQVKLGGIRVELEEIEAVLARHPRVRRCAVSVENGPQGSQRLIAFVVPDEANVPQEASPALPGAEAALADSAAKTAFKAGRPGLRDGLSGRTTIPLPEADSDSDTPHIFGPRRSQRTFSHAPVALSSLSSLLTAQRSVETDGWPKHLYPSAGGLYPVQVYVYAKPGRVDGIAPGTYYYHPVEHRLVLMSDEARIDKLVHAPVNHAVAESSAFSLFLVAQKSAIEPVYGALARDFCLLEAGYLAQVLTTVGPREGLGLCPIGSITQEDPVRRALGLSDDHEVLHVLVGGQAPDGSAGTDGSAADVEVSPSALRAYLRTKLPDSMVPVSYHIRDALPLTGNGKVDRKALKGDHVPVPAEPSAAQGALEEQVVAVVREVLSDERIGVDQNFSDVGATSVHIIRIAARLRSALGEDIAVTEVFQSPTARALAHRLADRNNGAAGVQEEAEDRVQARLAARRRRRGTR